MIHIRNEKPADYSIVEQITRKAFYNVYMPGCFEHYLVHIMREHEDFIPELDFVITLDHNVIGNMMYTKSKLIDEQGIEKEIITFGPISILPEYQHSGYGKMLMDYSFAQAKALGYAAIVIFGSPARYVSQGFQSCRKYHIHTADGKYPTTMLVKVLFPNALDGKNWTYYDSPVMAVDAEAALQYDHQFEKMEKKYLPSQEEFYILSHSFVE